MRFRGKHEHGARSVYVFKTDIYSQRNNTLCIMYVDVFNCTGAHKLWVGGTQWGDWTTDYVHENGARRNRVDG